jgi:hypothetical protein
MAETIPSDISKALERLSVKLRQIAKIIKCRCGCGGTLLNIDKRGNSREYINGHNGRGENNVRWRGGRFKRDSYWYVKRPNHPQADKQGYVAEHRIVCEEYLGRYLELWEIVHHKDGNGLNNDINNLILTSKREHRRKYHTRDFGQICNRCDSDNVYGIGIKKGKRKFRCRDCRLCWTIGCIRRLDYGQICLNCGSKYVIRNGSINNGKQGFHCKVCSKNWRVPISDLVVKKPDNDLRYEKRLKRIESKPRIYKKYLSSLS